MSLPLSDTSDNDLLRDADPAVFFALDFFAYVIETYVGDRLMSAVNDAGATRIKKPVAYQLPYNPEPFLTEQQIAMPLLAIYRKSSTFNLLTASSRQETGTLDLVYVLPPLDSEQMERVGPILHAIAVAIDNRAHYGSDPGYTPPGGTLGATVWHPDVSGVSKMSVVRATYGAFEPSAELFFPALVLELESRETQAADYSALNTTHANLSMVEDLKDNDGTKVADFVTVDFANYPTVASVAPTSGDKAGGVSITVTGTNFVVNTTPVVTLDGIPCTNVVVVSATSITCKTPAHLAYPSFVADLQVINADGLASDALTGAFTFTTP